MTKQEILAAFEQAEKDWSLPIETAFEIETHLGLCWYFVAELDLYEDDIREFLMPLWLKYQTRMGSAYNFNGYGDDKQGRAERLEAIKKVIIDLKNEMNEQV